MLCLHQLIDLSLTLWLGVCYYWPPERSAHRLRGLQPWGEVTPLVRAGPDGTQAKRPPGAKLETLVGQEAGFCMSQHNLLVPSLH